MKNHIYVKGLLKIREKGLGRGWRKIMEGVKIILIKGQWHH